MGERTGNSNYSIHKVSYKDIEQALYHLMDVIDERQNVIVSSNISKAELILAARDSTTGEVVGLVDIVVDEENTANITYRVHPDHQNKGIGSNLVKEALNLIRKENKFRLIKGIVVPNSTSEKILKGAGFQLQETMNLGRPRNIYVYPLLRT